MGNTARRALIVVAIAALVFTGAALAGLWLTPEPRAQIDYLVIGSVATFLMLGVVFGLLLVFWIKPREFLASRRPKPRSPQEGAPP